MVYVWGSYNTTGIMQVPWVGSTLNDGDYLGPQIPASIVCDAFFAFSKTWFDGLSMMYADGYGVRIADANADYVTQRTAVRAALIAGTTYTKYVIGNSYRRSNGGIHNYPRFSEDWRSQPWSYTGSFVPLFNSTQAISPWENNIYAIYLPPRRNWSFDSTFMNPAKLPPGTPFFQYIQTTGFRQNIYN